MRDPSTYYYEKDSILSKNVSSRITVLTYDKRFLEVDMRVIHYDGKNMILCEQYNEVTF